MKTIKKQGNDIKVSETIEVVMPNLDFINKTRSKLDFINVRISQVQIELQQLQAEKAEHEQNLEDFKIVV